MKLIYAIPLLTLVGSSLFAGVIAAATDCERAFLTQLGGDNFTALYEQNVFSGKFLNDLGEYEKCVGTDYSRYMLARYHVDTGTEKRSITGSFNDFVIGT